MKCTFFQTLNTPQQKADDTQLKKSAPFSEVTNLTKEPNACTDDIKTWMTKNCHLTPLNDDKTGRSSSLSLFVFLETFYRFPPWFDYSWLSQYPLLWFCQEPWIYSWLVKIVHEEVHKNLPNSACFELKRRITEFNPQKFLTELRRNQDSCYFLYPLTAWLLQVSPHGYT